VSANLILNLLGLIQGGATGAEVADLAGQVAAQLGQGGAVAPCPAPLAEPPQSEAEQEADDLAADLFLISDEQPRRKHGRGKHLHVDVVGFDDCD
jgi:hypothetical protein